MAKLRIHHGDSHVEVDLRRDLTATDARAFRAQTGMGLAEGFTRIYDADVLATLLWLVRRKYDAQLRWEEVADNFVVADVDRTLDARTNRAAPTDATDGDEEAPVDPE